MLCRPANSLTYLWRCFALSRWNVPLCEHGPERLHAVRVDRYAVEVLDVLARTVSDRLVILPAPVGTGTIRIDFRVRARVLVHKGVQRLPVHHGDDSRDHPVRLPVLRTHHRRLADRTPARALQLLPFRVAHARPLAAEIALVHLHRATEAGGRPATPRLPNPVQHEPRGLLCHFQVPVKLHARHALEIRDHEVDPERPLPERQVAPRQRRVRLQAEIAPAIPAPIGLGLARLHPVGIGAPALQARHLASGPQDRLEPRTGRVLRGEAVSQLHQADPLSVALSGASRHLQLLVRASLTVHQR